MRYNVLLTIALPGLIFEASLGAAPDSTAFTYQGSVIHNAIPVTNTCDFRVSLWPTSGGGNLLDTMDIAGINVVGGLFSLSINFGASVFSGEKRWLELSIKCPSDSSFQVIGPRQPIDAVPYAIHTRGIAVDENGNVGIGSSAPQSPLDIVDHGNGERAVLTLRTAESAAGSAGRLDWAQSDTVTGRIVNVFEGGGQLGLGFHTYKSPDLIESMHITAGGNVGIGTTAPAGHLHIDGGPNWTSHSWKKALVLSEDSSMELGQSNANTRFGIGSSNDEFYLFSSLTEDTDQPPSYRMILDQNGNFGIGSSPSELKLEIAGDFGRRHGSTGLWLWGSEIADRGDEVLRIRSGGGTVSFDGNDNVGIGTDVPAYKLHVIGTLSASSIRISGGGPANGRILTSTGTTGAAEWRDAPPPSGVAGGSLAGTYPNPSLAPNAVITITIADAAVTSPKLANQSVTQEKLAPTVFLPPGGPAGGDLTGTYPNPIVTANAINAGKLASDAASLAKVSGGQMSASAGVVGVGIVPPNSTSQLWVGGNVATRGQFKTITNSNAVRNAIGVNADGAGGADFFSSTGKANVLIGTANNNSQLGLVAVTDKTNGSTVKASMFVNAANEGVVQCDRIIKSAGTFRIDHPLDPSNKFLSHSFVESPDMKNIYDGIVITDSSGQAEIELPDWFEALNKDFRYQLTTIGSMASASVRSEVKDNRFAVETSKPNVKVSWQVTGIRRDPYALAHPILVEESKGPADRGNFLHPDLFGLEHERAIGRVQSTVDPQSPSDD